MLALPPVDPEALQEACGSDPSWICDRVLRATDNTGFAKTVDFLLARPLAVVVVLILAFVGSRLVRRAIRRFTASVGARAAAGAAPATVRAAARAETLGSVLRSISTAVIWGFAFLTILGELGINPGPLIAGAGIVGVAVGFGAQSLVKDFLSGLFMLIEDQYGVGDVVDLGDAKGTVEAVTLRTTRVRDVEGTVWHVPNGQIQRVGNKSQQWARAVLDTVVAPTTDVQRASDVLERTLSEMAADEQWSEKILEPPEVWGVEDIGPAGVTLRVVVKTQPKAQFSVLRSLRRRIKEAFEAEGIEPPPPPPVAATPSPRGR